MVPLPLILFGVMFVFLCVVALASIAVYLRDRPDEWFDCAVFGVWVCMMAFSFIGVV